MHGGSRLLPHGLFVCNIVIILPVLLQFLSIIGKTAMSLSEEIQTVDNE